MKWILIVFLIIVLAVVVLSVSNNNFKLFSPANKLVSRQGLSADSLLQKCSVSEPIAQQFLNSINSRSKDKL